MKEDNCFYFFHLLIDVLFILPFGVWVITGEIMLVLWLVAMLVVKLIAYTEEEHLRNKRR